MGGPTVNSFYNLYTVLMPTGEEMIISTEYGTLYTEIKLGIAYEVLKPRCMYHVKIVGQDTWNNNISRV